MSVIDDFRIFRACFPKLSLSEEDLALLTRHDGRFSLEGGFALTDGGRIILLCVSPEYRGRGIGTELLSQCEHSIAQMGYEKAVLGGELFGGAVDESSEFFRRRGYSLGNEFCEMFVDMSRAAVPHGYSDPLPPSEADFRFISGATDELVSAVKSVDEEWVQYFDSDIFCGFVGGRLVSFCIVEDDVTCALSGGDIRMGSVGCVGTIPSARGRGIGLKMVSLALKELSRRGCERCLIHQTHLDKWYGRLGAQTAFRFRMGEKIL